MTDINIMGAAVSEVTPDTAVVRAKVGTRDFPRQEDAQAQCLAALAQVRAAVSGFDRTYEQGARTRSWRDNDTKTDRYTSSIDVVVKCEVSNDRLNTLVTQLSALDNVRVSTSWEVSSALRKSTRDALLADAVRDAKRQAAAIAAAAGLRLTALKVVAEPALFPGGQGPARDGAMPRAAAFAASIGETAAGVQLVPEPVELTAEIAVSYGAE
jgi:uncharacterized protein YggE